MAPRTTASGRIDEPPMSPNKGAAPKTSPIKGATRLRLMTVWYRNRFTSARSCPWVASVSSVELFPYLAAKCHSLRPSSAWQSQAPREGRDQRRAESPVRLPSRVAAEPDRGGHRSEHQEQGSHSGSEDLADVSFQMIGRGLNQPQPLLFEPPRRVPDPNEPMMKRTKRNDVGEDWNTPERE